MGGGLRPRISSDSARRHSGREGKAAIPGERIPGKGPGQGAGGSRALPRRTGRERNPHGPEEGRGHGD